VKELGRNSVEIKLPYYLRYFIVDYDTDKTKSWTLSIVFIC
jgi:hypothetical protein